MKKTIIKGVALILFLFSTRFAFAQVDFEQGYFVDASGNKVTCLIKDYGKENIPETLIYKKEGATREEEIETATLQEFQIESRNFKKFTVEIDKSPNKPPFFSKVKSGEYKTETVFLQTLTKGEVSLYVFFDTELRIFFLQTENQTPVQLLKKHYRVSNKEFKVNYLFRQQLWNTLKCDSIQRSYLSRIKYNAAALNSVVGKYNNCRGGQSTNYLSKKAKSKFLFTGKFGVAHSGIELLLPFQDEFAKKFSPLIGLEFEWFLPIRKNNWSVFFNVNHQSYGGDEGNDPDIIINNHATLVFSYGVRYHVYPKDGKLHLFFNAMLSQPNFSNKTILETNTTLPGAFRTSSFEGTSLQLGLGMGAYLNSRWFAEYRIGDLGKKVGLNSSLEYKYPYQTLTIGYVIFNNRKP